MIYNKYPLSEIVDIISGGTPKKSVKEYWANGTIPWLSIKDFNNDNRHVYNSSDYITELGLENSSANLLEKGDVILSARGTVGEVAQLARRMAFNQSCFGLRANDKYTTNEYIYYWLKHNISYLKNNTHGSVFDTINRKTFENLYVELPTKQYQNEVTEILTSLDDKIELNKQITDTLEEITSTLFKRWFVDFEFPKENGNPYKSSGGEMVESELGEIPAGWEIKNINDISSNISKGTTPTSKDLSSATDKKKIYFIKVKDIQTDGYINFNNVEKIPETIHFNQLKRSILKEKDILLSIAGTVGRISYISDVYNGVNSNQAIAFIRLKDSDKYFNFLLYYMKSSIFQNEIASKVVQAVQANVSLSVIKAIRLVLPNDSNLKKFNELIQPIVTKIEILRNENESVIGIRDSLLTKLLSGEIEL